MTLLTFLIADDLLIFAVLIQWFPTRGMGAGYSDFSLIFAFLLFST